MIAEYLYRTPVEEKSIKLGNDFYTYRAMKHMSLRRTAKLLNTDPVIIQLAEQGLLPYERVQVLLRDFKKLTLR